VNVRREPAGSIRGTVGVNDSVYSKRQMVGVSTPKTASKLSAGRITAKTPRGFWQ